MRNAAIIALILLLSGPALAMPDGGTDSSRDRDEIVKRRQQMQQEYQRMREKRLEAIRAAAAETVAGTDAIRGWKDETTGRAGAIAPEIADPVASEQERKTTDSSSTPGSGGGSLPLILVGGGVLLALVLRVFLPWVFEYRLFGILRGNQGPARRGEGAQTMTLRPRKERLKGRSG